MVTGVSLWELASSPELDEPPPNSEWSNLTPLCMWNGGGVWSSSKPLSLDKQTRQPASWPSYRRTGGRADERTHRQRDDRAAGRASKRASERTNERPADRPTDPNTLLMHGQARDAGWGSRRRAMGIENARERILLVVVDSPSRSFQQ